MDAAYCLNVEPNEDDYHRPYWGLSSNYDEKKTLPLHLSILLTALSVAQKPIERLSVGLWRVSPFDKYDGRTRDKLNGVEVAELQTLDPRGALYRGLRPALCTLRSLRLALEYGGLRSPHSGMHGEQYNNERTEIWLRDFLSLAPVLEHLS